MIASSTIFPYTDNLSLSGGRIISSPTKFIASFVQKYIPSVFCTYSYKICSAGTIVIVFQPISFSYWQFIFHNIKDISPTRQYPRDALPTPWRSELQCECRQAFPRSRNLRAWQALVTGYPQPLQTADL